MPVKHVEDDVKHFIERPTATVTRSHIQTSSAQGFVRTDAYGTVIGKTASEHICRQFGKIVSHFSPSYMLLLCEGTTTCQLLAVILGCRKGS